MGSYATLGIGKYDYMMSKNCLSDFLLIFNSWERREEKYIEDEQEFTSYKYVTTVKTAKQCLDFSGYGLAQIEKAFTASREDMEYLFEHEYDDKAETAIAEYTFDSWRFVVKNYARKLSSEGYPWKAEDDAWFNNIEKVNVSEYIVARSLRFNSFSFWGLPEGIDPWIVFRIVLEAFDDDDEVVLDYGDLVEGGWCDAIPNDDEFVYDKVLVLTEGVTDSEFISSSIKLLYPHLNKFFHFMDFGIMKVSGSVSFLAHYIKAFAGAKINNRIIGLFDNDSAAKDELLNLRGIRLPHNIKIVSLPDIELARNYPTLGPMQNQDIDINGLACSIELFFGKDVLQRDDGSLTPIRWTGYKDRISQYQGEIQDKSILQEKFRNKLALAEQVQDIEKANWKEMIILIETLISVVNNIRHPYRDPEGS